MREQIDIKDIQIKILKKQLEEAKEYIEKACTYDKHLMGYCRGLKSGQVRTLVYKLGGRNVKEKE